MTIDDLKIPTTALKKYRKNYLKYIFFSFSELTENYMCWSMDVCMYICNKQVKTLIWICSIWILNGLQLYN